MSTATRAASNFVALVNGHEIYRDGERCSIWTDGVGWWAFDLPEAEARLTAETVQPPDTPKADDLKAERLPQAESRKCLSCGEPEDGGQFGWFDADDGLHCNSCGSDPLAKPKKKKAVKNGGR
jgi:DNA-directed RNA polymerase subunit RPC12/RpoP